MRLEAKCLYASLAAVSRFAIPRHFKNRRIRRYRFHGLSFKYIASRLAVLAPKQANKRAWWRISTIEHGDRS